MRLDNVTGLIGNPDSPEATATRNGSAGSDDGSASGASTISPSCRATPGAMTSNVGASRRPAARGWKIWKNANRGRSCTSERRARDAVSR